MEIGNVPQKYKSVKLSPEEKAQLFKTNKCFICKNVGFRASKHRRKKDKKLKESLFDAGTTTGSCIIAEEDKKRNAKKYKKYGKNTKKCKKL